MFSNEDLVDVGIEVFNL